MASYSDNTDSWWSGTDIQTHTGTHIDGTGVDYISATHFVCPNCLRIISMKKAFLAAGEERTMYFCSEKCSKGFDESKSVPMEI